MPTPRPLAFVVFALFASSASAAQPASRVASPEGSQGGTGQAPAAQAPATGPGRVVVLVSVEGLRIPAVDVELRDADGNVVVGQTTSDAVGQATFPDVPAGRYIVRAVREGFADAESSPFNVQAGVTEQVLVEMRLTFVRESVDVVVPANSPTESLQPVAVSDVLTGAKMDIQPLAGDDFQSLLTLLPSIIRGPDGRLRIKGGGADDRRAAGQQREPQRPVHRRLRSRAAERRRRVGRSAVESVRRRVRAASRPASRRSAPSAAPTSG